MITRRRAHLLHLFRSDADEAALAAPPSAARADKPNNTNKSDVYSWRGHQEESNGDATSGEADGGGRRGSSPSLALHEERGHSPRRATAVSPAAARAIHFWASMSRGLPKTPSPRQHRARDTRPSHDVQRAVSPAGEGCATLSSAQPEDRPLFMFALPGVPAGERGVPQSEEQQQQQQPASPGVAREAAGGEADEMASRCGPLPSCAASLSPRAAPGRPTQTQLKEAWRGVLRDVAALRTPSCGTRRGVLRLVQPSGALHHAASSSQRRSASPARVAVRDITCGGGGANTSSSAAGGKGEQTDASAGTALHRARERTARVRGLQLRLHTELHHYFYSQERALRLRLLFNAAEDNEDAYWRHVAASHADGDADVLRMISAVDEQLQRHFLNVYQPPSAVRDCGPRHVLRLAGGGSARSAEPSAPVTDAAARTELIDAAIREAMRKVESTRMLLPHQLEGVRWILRLNCVERVNGILADDMGLGKTAQTVLYLACYKCLAERVVEQRLQGLLEAVRVRWLALDRAQRATLLRDGLANSCSSSAPQWCGGVHHFLSNDGHQANPHGSHHGATNEEHVCDVEEMRADVAAIRALKEVKRWISRLGEADAPGAHASEEEADASSPAANGPHPPKKRGRPPTPRASSSSSASGADHEDPAHAALRLLDDVLRVPHCSAALNRLLESPRGMQPIMITAPLSTLPHWREEFTHFRVDHLFSLYVLSGSRAERDVEVRRFLHHAQHMTASRSAAHATERHTPRTTGLGGPRAHMQQPGPVAGAPLPSAHATITTTAPTPVLLVPHDWLVKPLLGLHRRVPLVQWQLLVVDEAQRIKNTQSELFQKLMKLRSLSRFLLTGTPLQNNVTELFSLLQFLAPEAFDIRRQRDLLERLDAALLRASREDAPRGAEVQLLLCRRVHRLLAPFILRRNKTALAHALPPKLEFVLTCPLTPLQRVRLREVEEKHRLGCLSGNPSIYMRKILLHPYTAQPFFYIGEDVVRASGKLLALDFMMRFLQKTGHKFLVFCSWTKMLDVVETLCVMRGIGFVRLDGKTSVEQREINISSFNSPTTAEDAPPRGDGDGSGEKRPADQLRSSYDGSSAPCCFLISKVAGGVGLNLQAADTVLLLDVDYNPQRDNQALSRVYRVGQSREVRVCRLVTEHLLEAGVMEVHERRMALDHMVVQAGGFDLHSSPDDREAELSAYLQQRRAALSRDATCWQRWQLPPASPEPVLSAGIHSADALREAGGDAAEAHSADDLEATPLSEPNGDATDTEAPGSSRGEEAPHSPLFEAPPELDVLGDQTALDDAALTSTPAAWYVVQMCPRLRQVLVRNADEEVVFEKMMREERQQLMGKLPRSISDGEAAEQS